MSKPDVTFVNHVAVNGFLNGVCNLSLSQSRFVPSGEGNKVALEHHIVLDLRFDLFCAQQIRDALDKIIADNTKPAAGVN